MAENREYLTRAEENGSINIAEDVVAAKRSGCLLRWQLVRI